MTVTYITGNPHKAAYFKKLIDLPVAHQKVDLDEIQSLDLKEIVRHKVRQAYQQVGGPVLVEDTSLEFHGLGGLPGPFIKFFLERLSYEKICALVDGQNRACTARCVFGYFDGVHERLFEGSHAGRIPETPAQTGGFGWDGIYIPDGYEVTRAELPEADELAVYQQIKPIAAVREFLEARQAGN